MPETTEKPMSDDEILAEARDQFHRSDLAEKDMRDEHKRCQRFLGLEQWNQDAVSLRGWNTPTLVVDHLNPIKHQIVNDWIRNRMGIKIAPADEEASEETATILSGYVRNCEYLSKAQNVYDMAVDQMVGGGFSYLGVTTRRKPGTFKQELCIRGFRDPLCVYSDPFAKEMDQSDVAFRFVRDLWSEREFKARFPKAQNSDFAAWGSEFADWVKDGGAIVAEYWKLTQKARKLQLLTHAIPVQRGKRVIQTDTVWDSEYPELPEGVTVAPDPANDGQPQEEDDPEPIVTNYLMTGKEILSRTRWLGRIIPIVPMIAREMVIDGNRKTFSAISSGLDPQCQLNYAESSIGEEMGTTVKSPYIGAVGQFVTAMQAWQDANLKRFAFLEYDIVLGPNGQMAPPPQRASHEPQIQAYSLAADRAANNIRMTCGVSLSSLGHEDSSVKSGVAINSLKSEGDNATYDFPAAGARALALVGDILVDVGCQIIGDDEVIQILDEQEKQVSVLVNGDPSKHSNPKIRAQKERHFLEKGQYRVRVSAAPSHQTMREEREAKLGEIYKESPPEAQARLLAPMIRAMDFDDKDQLADRVELPEFKKPEDGAPEVPPEAQAVIQAGEQTIRALKAHVDELERQISTKALENASKEKIAAMDNETKVAVAQITADTKKQVTDLGQQVSVIQHQLEMVLQHAQMVENSAEAEAQRQHASQTQGADQTHQQQMASQAQAQQAAQAQEAAMRDQENAGQ